MKLAALAGVRAEMGQKRGFILANLAVGHGINHMFMQSFLVIQPYIKATMGLSDVQFGLLTTVRQATSGAINLPAGFLIDLVKRQWGLILTACMVMTAVFYGLAGDAEGAVDVTADDGRAVVRVQFEGVAQVEPRARQHLAAGARGESTRESCRGDPALASRGGTGSE
jgi:hypothetical protein